MSAAPSQPLDILLVEDNPGDVRLIQEMLKGLQEPGCTLTCRDRLSEAQRFLGVRHPEVILMDLGLPDAYGLEALEGIRGLANGTPVVVLTAMNDQRVAHRALEKGAQDYLVKGTFDGGLLLRSIRYAIDRQQRESALKASEARTRNLLETCLIGIVLADSEGRILDANHAFLQLLGYSREEAKNGPILWDERVTGPGVERHFQALRDLKAGRGHPPWEVDFLKRDGSTVPILLGAAPLDGPENGTVIYAMDISERKAFLDQLQREARQDSLTGLRNRRAFLEILDIAMAAAQRYGHPLSLAIGDLDGFKQVNDRHGHGAGDEVLRAFGELLAREIRGDDVPARLGGDEFCVLFPHVSANQAARSLERVRRSFAGKVFSGAQGATFSLTASFGLMDLPPGVRSPEGLFQLADEALYRAKAEGKNRIGLG